MKLLETKKTRNKYKIYFLGKKIFGHRFENDIFDKDFFNEELFGVFTKLKIELSAERKPTINIFLPQLCYKMSAGPLSILWVAKTLYDWGYPVRFIVLSTDNKAEAKQVISSQETGLQDFADNVEIDFSLPEERTLFISPDDISIATLFTTAYFAKELQKLCKNKKFIYMIQDYESGFFSMSSSSMTVENTYSFDYYALFSTDILQNYFLAHNVGRIKDRKIKYISYDCPANSYLPSKSEFISLRKPKKQFVFYCRPHSDRNAFALGAYSIINAVEKGIFAKDEWEFWGVGAPKAGKIKLADGLFLNQVLNMPLEEYKRRLPSFDIALSLMATPHPSMPPIDFALSGIVTVTNSSAEKTENIFSLISKNIITCNPDIDSISDALALAVQRMNDWETRYKNANVPYPHSWQNVFNNKHKEWFADILQNMPHFP